MPHALDNPVWASLTSLHAGLARRGDGLAAYPAAIAPFAAVETEGADAGGLEALVDAGQSVLFVGPAPQLSPRWTGSRPVAIAQMTLERPLDAPAGPEVIALGEADLADVLDLVARVYPHYFRPRTMDMGRYFGIRVDGVLAAMIGERMGFPGHRELSAICTDPAFLGRGLARRLMAHLANDILVRGDRPFLHVSHGNRRAKALYEAVGFHHRRDVQLLEARRAVLG
ncbi:GNAT family N-acetyltransferase [Marilutibacter aestuarii]|uniref:GNAT family N-acetyltransferase n=1 Tax=Marilutibacter aestuarii TaxID=1706195 RepID=A0A508AW26_9GAMM|nr:GNAT family N-acetyltransferase [Lysobacter aestuarii]TQD51265.1 GNAT family N-acetyltransferase [Lysobacter aestuarii]